MPQQRPPFLHDLCCLVAAPTQVWSAWTGDIDPRSGGQGILHADVRVLSALELTVDGHPVEHIATDVQTSGVRFTYLLRDVGSVPAPAADPGLRLDRVRRIQPGSVAEELVVSSVLDQPVELSVRLRAAADLAPIELIRVGGAGPPHSPIPVDHGATWTDGTVAGTLSTETADVECQVHAGVDDLTLSWLLAVPPRGSVSMTWRLDLSDRRPVVLPAAPGRAVDEQVERALEFAGSGAADPRVRPWIERAFSDLAGLRMATDVAPSDAFYAAGAPWYLTLFGRDSILSARMMLAIDPTPAAGTLRTLARLQGTRSEPEAAEQPGKILHELRRGTFAFADLTLPPHYYGTIDATPLWVCLLHDAWRTGLDESVVHGLLPHLEAALDWLVTYGDADGDGFLEYLDPTGHGLANQGWKDSADSIRFADGRIATGPVALCEVQGYAYEAAVRGADLLDAFGRSGGDRYRHWATDLADRFRDRFWCARDGLRFPALALDGAKRRVDALTSNIGHLLGTGLLDAEEEQVVAEVVSGAELDSGLGLRTMAASDGGYDPLSYHCGSVWPHDTAMVIAGLVRAGLAPYARGLVDGLLKASMAFGGRLPELWSGEGRPVPYPVACRPQAWSATAVVPVLTALGQLFST